MGGGGRRGFLRRSGGIEKYLEGFERDDGFKWLAGNANIVGKIMWAVTIRMGLQPYNVVWGNVMYI